MRYLFVLILLFGIALPAHAQDDEPGDCGNGLPCGPIPWDLPLFPQLISPTPISESVDVNPFLELTPTATPTITFTPSITPTPAPTTTAFFNQDVLDDNIATISAIIDHTSVPLFNAEGTPIANEDVGDLASNAGTFFSYLKGLSLEATLGIFAPLLAITLFYLNLNFFLGILKFTFPMIAMVIGVVRKVVNVILNFT